MQPAAATPLIVPIREDRTGPDSGGFERTDECGCLMTHVCRFLGLTAAAQMKGNPGSTELHEKLIPHGAPTDSDAFWILVKEVQSRQDNAWRSLLNWFHWMEESDQENDEYFDEDGDWTGKIPVHIADERNRLMMFAFQALGNLGVEVRWIEGQDDVDERGQEYEWLRAVPGYRRVE